MSFHIIDKTNWNRAQTYAHFTQAVPCTYSMTVNIDITALYRTIKANNLKFFPTTLYGISSVVNQHKAFRMDLDADGNVGYYDVSHPNYTVFHKDTETFTNAWTAYDANSAVFLRNYNTETNEPPPRNTFNVSAIPWTSFTGFNLNLQKGYDYYPPIFTIGKFYEDGEKYLLPLAIQVNHAVCDGFHVAQFVDALQEWADGVGKHSI